MAEKICKLVSIIILLKSLLLVIALTRLTSVIIVLIYSRLSLFHLVLNISKDEIMPVRLFHLLLQDFLLDPKTSEKCLFWVDKIKMYKMIIMKCLR